MGKGTMSMDVQLRGFTELRRRIGGSDLYAAAWTEVMEKVGELGSMAAQAGGPIGPTGRLVARITHKVDRQPVPRYAVVKTTAKQGRYSYPGFTNYSPYASRIHPNRKDGQPRRARPNPNQGWLGRAMQRIRPAINPILRQAASQIQARWVGTR